MFEWISDWLIKDICPKSVNADDVASRTLRQYMRLMGRVFVFLAAIAAVFILITAIVGVTSSPYFSINLELDGQTLSSYVGVVFGTVVALAGSLLAILLAQKAINLQESQEEQVKVQNKLMLLEQEREYTILYDHKISEYQKLMLELSGLLGSCLAAAGELRQKSSVEAALLAVKSYKNRNNINSILAGLHGLSILPSHSAFLLKKYGIEIKYLSNQIEALRLKIMEITSNQTARRFFTEKLLQCAPEFINSAYFASSEKAISERSSSANLMANFLLKNKKVDQDLCFLLLLLSPLKTQESPLFFKELVDSFPSGVERVISVFEKESNANADKTSDGDPHFNGLEKAARMSNLQRSFIFSDEIVDGLNKISEAISSESNEEKIRNINSGQLNENDVRAFVKEVYKDVLARDIEELKILNDEIRSFNELGSPVGDLVLVIKMLDSHFDAVNKRISLHEFVFDNPEERTGNAMHVALSAFNLVTNFFRLDLSSVHGGNEVYAKAYRIISTVFKGCNFEAYNKHIMKAMPHSNETPASEYTPVIYDFYLRGLAAPNENLFSFVDRIDSIKAWKKDEILLTPADRTMYDGIRVMLDRLSWLDSSRLDKTYDDNVDMLYLLEAVRDALEFVKIKDYNTTGYERDHIHRLLDEKIQIIDSIT